MAIIRLIGARVLGWVWRQLHRGRCRGCTGGHVCLFTPPQSGSSILNILHRHMTRLLHCCLSKTPTLPGAMIHNKHKSSSHSQPMQSLPFSVHYLPFRELFTEHGPAGYTDLLLHWIINYKLDFEMLLACLVKSECFPLTVLLKWLPDWSRVSVFLTLTNSSPTHEEKVNSAFKCTLLSLWWTSPWQEVKKNLSWWMAN